MDDISKLIEEFSLLQKSTEQFESHNKIRLIQILGAEINDRVLEIFLNILDNPDEFDLARVEVLKVLQVSILHQEQASKVVRSLVEIIIKDEDELIRQYAACTLANFMSFPEAVECAKTLVLTQDEDIDVRHNALFALERHGSQSALKFCLDNLQDTDSIKPFVRGLIGRLKT